MNRPSELTSAIAAGRPGAVQRYRDTLASAAGSPAERAALLDALAAAAAGGDAGAKLCLAELLGVLLDERLAERPVRRVLIDQADVEDAVQTTLVAVAERIHQFDGRARFTTWLHTVARNEALMVVRRKRRLTEPSGEDVPEQHGFVQRLSSFVGDRDRIERAIAQLPEIQRVPLLMREFDGLEYGEIADALGLPIGTVRSRISRGRSALAGLLRESVTPGAP